MIASASCRENGRRGMLRPSSRYRTSRKARCSSETWPGRGDAGTRRRWEAAGGFGPSIFLPFDSPRRSLVPVPPAVPSSSRRRRRCRASLPHADHPTRRPDQQSRRRPCWPLGDCGFHRRNTASTDADGKYDDFMFNHERNATSSPAVSPRPAASPRLRVPVPRHLCLARADAPNGRYCNAPSATISNRLFPSWSATGPSTIWLNAAACGQYWESASSHSRLILTGSFSRFWLACD